VRAAQVAFPPGGWLAAARRADTGTGAPGVRPGDLVAVTDRACHREAVEPSAVDARRTRASLALAVVGAIVLMAGVALVLSGEAVKLEHQAHPPSLIGPGLVLAFLGLALGASAAVTILLDAPTRLPAAHPHPLAPAAPDDPSGFGPPPGDRSAFGPPPADPVVHGEVVAGEVLSSDRLSDPVPPAAAARTEVVPGAALSPPGRTGPAFAGPPPGEEPAGPGSAEPGPSGPGSAAPGSAAPGWVPGAREPVAGEVPGYSDAGWGAGADGQTWPDPPPEPPQEIHHPVRR
jgi:hypothetical protein